jgi:hypothetical protein
MEGEEEGETRQQQQPLNSPAAAVHGEEGRRRRGGGFGAAAASPRRGQEMGERERKESGPGRPESLARQGGAHAPPRQLRSTTPATVASLVAPVHVA